MWNMIYPILIVIVANTFYHICSKSVDSEANSFGALTITYLVAATVSAIAFIISSHGKNLVQEITKNNWASFALGFVIVGLEFGWLCVYRAGWQISKASVIANIALACVLVFVGLFLYKESLTPQKIIGIAVCAVGLILLNV